MRMLSARTPCGGFFRSLSHPGYQQKEDDAECQRIGLKRGTDGYADCRLRLKEIHAYECAPVRSSGGSRRTNRALPPPVASNPPSDPHVYRRSECIGPVIMGECKGIILPDPGYHPTCHGAMLTGYVPGRCFEPGLGPLGTRWMRETVPGWPTAAGQISSRLRALLEVSRTEVEAPTPKGLARA